MEQYVIEGQTKLRGVLPVHGAKNAALPILAGTLPFCNPWAAGCSRSRVW